MARDTWTRELVVSLVPQLSCTLVDGTQLPVVFWLGTGARVVLVTGVAVVEPAAARKTDSRAAAVLAMTASHDTI